MTMSRAAGLLAFWRAVRRRSTYPLTLILAVSTLSAITAVSSPTAFATSTPTITSLDVISGVTAGGTTVTITGTNLTGATSVTVDGNAATNVTVNSATSVAFTTPSGSTGAKDVVITTPTGSATKSGGFTYYTTLTPACSGGGTFTIVNNVVTTSASCVGPVTIPEGVTEIGTAALCNNTNTCTNKSDNLGAVTLPSSLITLDAYAFMSSGMTSVSFNTPINLATIGIKAFSYTGLTSFTIPSSVTSLQGAAFYNSSSLSSVTFQTPSSLTSIGALPGGNNEGMFQGTAITSLSLPSSMTAINYRLDGALTQVTLNGNITSMYSSSFPSTIECIINPNNYSYTNNFAYPNPPPIVVTSSSSCGTPPTIGSLSPTSGLAAGGTLETLTGTNLTGVNKVWVNGVLATNVTVVSATTLTFYTPASATAGAVAVWIDGSTGPAIKASAFSYINFDATLSNLVLSGSNPISPTFSSATTSYTASVVNSVSTIQVTPTHHQANSTIKVNGTTVTSGTASTAIALSVGSNTINVVVTAQDGTTTDTYSIVITRAAGLPSRTISFTSPPTSLTYGTTATLVATPSAGGSDGTISYSVGASTGCALTGTVLRVIDATGTCSITASIAGGTSYADATTGATTVTLSKASLTITASSPTVIYGASTPSITASYSGFVNSDSAASLTTLPTCATTYTSSSPAGTPVATSCSGAVSNNYSFSYVAGAITITAAGRTISFTTPPASLTYGSTVTLVATPSAGGSDGTISYSVGASTGCALTGTVLRVIDATGTCSITASIAGGTNYSDATSGATTVTLNKASLTVHATNIGITYGGTPTPTFTTSGLQYTDAIDAVSYAYSGANSPSAPTAGGTYSITPSAAHFSSGLSSNYTITYTAGVFTIQNNSIGNLTNSDYGASLVRLTASDSATVSTTIAVGASTVSVTLPATSLPAGTHLDIYPMNNNSATVAALGSGFTFITSLLVSWLAPDLSTPVTNAGVPITMTITDPGIKAGQSVYTVIGANASVVAQATVDGQVSFSITQDPIVTIASTVPGAPTAVSGTAGDAQSIISWTAPLSNGGSVITGYTVTASPGGATCSTTGATSCNVTGLTNGTAHTFSVIAINAVGNSAAATSSLVTPVAASGNSNNPPVSTPQVQTPLLWTITFDSNGATIGFAPDADLVAPNSSLTITLPGNIGSLTNAVMAVPMAKTGFTFGGWNLISSAAVSLSTQFTPTASTTLFAVWIATPVQATVPSTSDAGGSIPATPVAQTQPPRVAQLIIVKIYFAFGSAVVAPEYVTKIKTLAVKLKGLSHTSRVSRITITGYAQPTPNTEASDALLAANRARAVANLLAHYGVTEKMRVVGGGRTQTDSPASRFAEIVVKLG